MTATILTFRGAEPPILPALPILPAPRQRTAVGVPLPLQRPRRELSPAEAEFQARLLDEYFAGHRLSHGHEAVGVAASRGYVEDFLDFVGQPLWACTTADFSSWCGHLGYVRNDAPNTQRNKQCAIASFWDYLVDEPTLQSALHQNFQTRFVRVATRANRRIHIGEGAARERQYLVAEELDNLFEILAAIVEVAAHEAPRRLKAFQRDRAMFFTYYAFGLRLAEGHRLNLHSFSKNPDLPELGKWGLCYVFNGKGSNGSGPRPRLVPSLLAGASEMLDWYVDEVRPKFRRKDADDPALWFSEQGNRLCRASIAARFKTLLELCGLPAHLFSPHGLRHMHVSHQAAADVPTSFTQTGVGHVSAAVTARYTHLPDGYARDVAYNYVHAALGDLPEGA